MNECIRQIWQLKPKSSLLICLKAEVSSLFTRFLKCNYALAAEHDIMVRLTSRLECIVKLRFPKLFKRRNKCHLSQIFFLNKNIHSKQKPSQCHHKDWIVKYSPLFLQNAVEIQVSSTIEEATQLITNANFYAVL